MVLLPKRNKERKKDPVIHQKHPVDSAIIKWT